jgi:L-asparaginase/Glu-tRNA(Gln) amidotransferase subunit D
VEGPQSFVGFLGKHARDLPVFFSAFPSRYISKPYESTVKLVKAGGIVLADLQPHVVFALLALALAQGKTVDDVKRLLDPWCLKF